MIEGQSNEPIEISQKLTRLRAVTDKPEEKTRYYVPRELESKSRDLLKRFNSKTSGGVASRTKGRKDKGKKSKS